MSVINISPSMDPPFAGLVVTTVFLGITLVQAWIYANNNNDGWKLRSLVALLVAMDIGTTITNAMFTHEYLVKDFGDYFALLGISSSISGEYGLTNATTLIVQLFFATRVYLLNKKNCWFPAIIVAGALMGSGTGIYPLVQYVLYPYMTDLTRRSVEICLILEKVGDLVSDTAATIALSLYLNEARINTNVKQTIVILQKLLTFILVRGILVTAVSLVILIMYVVRPGSLYWFPLYMLLPKIYVLTMVSMLNSRSPARETEVVSSNSFIIPASHMRDYSTNEMGFSKERNTDLTINVSTTYSLV